jgi:predicted nuclease of predicted toxin-antitoxin system
MTAIGYYLDEHVARAIAHGLAQRGIEAVLACDEGMSGADDLIHLQFATSQQRTVYTNDADFLRHHDAGVPHAGIVYARVGIRIRDALDGLEVVLQVYSAEEMRNRVEFL